MRVKRIKRYIKR